MRAKKYLSMLLVVVMMLSLFPVNAFALGGGSDIGIGGGFGRDIGDDEVRDFDPSNLIEDAEEPVDLFSGVDTENGIQVTVESRNNALPTMAEVRVTPVDPDSVREAVAAVVDGQPNVLVAMDISFWLDGIEIEPEEPVNVKISAPELTDRTGLQVIHIPDADEEDALPNTVELISENEMSIPVGTNEVAFKADSFSIYVITSGEDDTLVTPRVTYHFLNVIGEDGSAEPFSFLNKAGETVDYQILKGDEKLAFVAPPVTGLGSPFVAWYVATKNEDGTFTLTNQQVKFDPDAPVIGPAEDEDTDVYVAPVYGTAYIVSFWDSPEGSDENHVIAKRLVVIPDGATAGEVRVDNVNVPTTSTTTLTGWRSTNYAEGTTEYSIKDMPKWTNVTRNCDLYPILSEGHWLRFVSGPLKGGASYVAAVFVSATTEASELASLTVPDRTGFTFDGWYTGSQDTATGAITYNDRVSDGSGNVSNPNALLTSLQNADVTLYGKWNGNSVEYRVVTWYQNPDDDGYSYHGVDPRSGTAGTTTNVSASSVTGFTAKAIQQQEIKGDGSTVVNIYYDRNYYDIKFNGTTYTPTTSTNGTQYGLVDGQYVQLTRSGSSWYYYDYGWQQYRGTRYTRSTGWIDALTIHAKYGQDIHNEWPGVKEGTESYGAAWYIDTSYRVFMTSITTMPLNGANYYEKSSGQYPLNTLFMVQSVNGENSFDLYVEAPYRGDDARTTADDYTAIKGFRLNAASQSDANAIKANPTGDDDAVYDPAFNTSDAIGSYYSDAPVVDGYYTLYFYYLRNQYDVTFEENGGPAVSDLTGIYYEANIADVKADGIAAVNSTYKLYETKKTVPGEGEFEFAGWFDNEACVGDRFDFNQEMPAGSITLYAKWEPVTYLVKIDPRGGEITADGEVTFTWLPYDTKVGTYNIRRPYVEDDDGQYMYMYVPYSTENEDIQSTERKAKYVTSEEQLTDAQKPFLNNTQKYSPESPTDYYSFVGWYDEATNLPFNFNEGVKGETSIYAVWRRSGLFQVVYDCQATEGETTVTGKIGNDSLVTEFGYADQAETKIAYTPTGITSTDGKAYVFYGWKLQGDEQADRVFTQGDDFKIEAKYADKNHFIHLKAVYQLVDNSDIPRPITSITFNSNYPDGSTSVVKTIDHIPLNTEIDLAAESFVIKLVGMEDRTENLPKFTFTSYKQKEWNTKADGSGLSFGLTDVIGVDDLDKGEINPDDNILYAIWVPQNFFIFHSSTGKLEAVPMTAVDENGKFDLTSKLSANTLYGGYFNAYLGSDFVTDEQKAAAENASDKTTVVTDSDYVTYDASAAYKKINGKVALYWAKGNAYTEVKGTELVPADDTVYYLREVPNRFLGFRLQYVYDYTKNNQIDNLLFFTTVDSNIYQSAGFNVSTDYGATFYASYKIVFDEGENAPIQTPDVIINAELINGSKGGLVGVRDLVKELIENMDKGSTFTVLPYWITMDGVRVDDTLHGSRTFNIGDKTATEGTGISEVKVNP